MSELVRVSKTRCQGHQDPSRSVSIFDREIEANVKMEFQFVSFLIRGDVV